MMTTSPREASPDTIWEATHAFLIEHHPALVIARAEAQASFLESRYQILLEEFELFASESALGFGPWLLQLEARPDEFGHVHYWWRQQNIRPVGISEARLWDELFPPGGQYASSADHFAAEFTAFLSRRGVMVTLESTSHGNPLEFLPKV